MFPILCPLINQVLRLYPFPKLAEHSIFTTTLKHLHKVLLSQAAPWAMFGLVAHADSLSMVLVVRQTKHILPAQHHMVLIRTVTPVILALHPLFLLLAKVQIGPVMAQAAAQIADNARQVFLFRNILLMLQKLLEVLLQARMVL